MMDPIWKTMYNSRGEEYNVRIILDEAGRLSVDTSCDCKYASYYRFSKKNIIQKKWVCRHILKAYAEVIKVDPYRAREILIRHRILNPMHLRKI